MNVAVSIIMPCHNGAPFLRETLQSALNQTHAPLEVIVVDDGSTDDSTAIAESFGPPVRVIRQRNLGESVAQNVGIAAAWGDYLVFLDADDLLAPATLETQIEQLRDGVRGVTCAGHAAFTDDPRKPIRITMAPLHGWLPEIIHQNLGPPGCWMVSKEVILQAGCFHAPMRYFEDWDLWWRVALTGTTYVPVPMVGFLYLPAVSAVAIGDHTQCRSGLGPRLVAGADVPDLSGS